MSGWGGGGCKGKETDYPGPKTWQTFGCLVLIIFWGAVEREEASAHVAGIGFILKVDGGVVI